MENLQHLELHLLEFGLKSISLPKLKTLTIRNYHPYKVIEIEDIVCPELTYLSIEIVGKSRKHYLIPKLKKLICDRFTAWIRNQTTLETLIIRRIDSEGYDLLNFLPYLKMLDVYEVNKSVFHLILKDKENLKKDDLTICYKGLTTKLGELLELHLESRIKDDYSRWLNFTICSIDRMYFIHQALVSNELNFYDRIAIDFSFLIFTDEFLSKLQASVTILQFSLNLFNDPKAKRIFKNFNKIKELYLTGMIVNKEEIVQTQNSFNELPECFPYLIKLSIKMHNLELINFDFVQMFKEIAYFKKESLL